MPHSADERRHLARLPAADAHRRTRDLLALFPGRRRRWLHERFSAEAVWADIRDGRASHVSLVPAMLAQMLDIAGKTPPPASLRCVLIGGAALSHQLWQRQALRAGRFTSVTA